jgi:2-oxoglutarate ferredoxin oxidoreductase subunit beta
MPPLDQYDSEIKPNWCPGCGNFGNLIALKRAMSELDLNPEKTLIVSGIGCSSEIIFWLKTYGFQSIHGRILPVATAAHLCHHELKVICYGGDGDGYGIGLNHTLHAMRRNLNLTYIVADNQIYGLTKGQTSPTSLKGTKSPSTPFGAIDEPVSPIPLAIVAGATYVARAFSGNIAHMTKIIKEGIAHQGFSLIDIFQPCVTFNKINTYDYFREKCYELEQEKGFDPTNKEQALKQALVGFEEKVPIGLFYKSEQETFDQQLPQIAKTPLCRQSIEYDISDLLKTFI